jgi:tetratricopeptide (TPR) repeat protein
MAIEPQQPTLPERLDPNDAHAVYAYGVSLLRSAPARAAQVFHWAGRLDPTWADPLYARRVALLMVDPAVFSEYMRGAPKLARSPGVQKVDSLYRQALMLNPFLQQRHDVMAIKQTLAWSIERELRRNNPGVPIHSSEVEQYIDRSLQRAEPAVAAWVAHSEGRFAAAQESYRRALSRSGNKAYLRADLARVQVLMGRFQDAREEMTLALEALRETDQKKLIRVYESKALYEHSIGLILEQLDDLPGAREAYARALQEDLSYYPSHLRLGDLALSAGDTATALGEFELAVQIREDDAGIRFKFAELLLRAGRFQAAESEARRAIALEPVFALPYFLMAEAVYAQGRHADASEHYRDFMERTSRQSPQRGYVESRLGEISAASGQAGAR